MQADRLAREVPILLQMKPFGQVTTKRARASLRGLITETLGRPGAVAESACTSYDRTNRGRIDLDLRTLWCGRVSMKAPDPYHIMRPVVHHSKIDAWRRLHGHRRAIGLTTIFDKHYPML
jgi:hypothetical protein